MWRNPDYAGDVRRWNEKRGITVTPAIRPTLAQEPRFYKVPFDTQEAFPDDGGEAICPVCGLSQRVPRRSPAMALRTDHFQSPPVDVIYDLFICGKDRSVPSGEGCKQRFLFNRRVK